MATKKKSVGKEKENKRIMPDLKTIKAGKDGYKKVTNVFSSEFFKFEEVDQIFEGKFVEIMQAGKKGEEKDCALFQEKKTNKSYLFGQKAITDATEAYGVAEYRITFKGKVKLDGGRTFNNFDVEVK